MPDTQTNAPNAQDSPANRAEWVSVARFASLEGVSTKTVWRRAKSGQLEARKVASGRGGLVWEIALKPTGQTDRTATDRPDKTERTQTGQTASIDAVSSVKPTDRPDKSDRPTDRTTTGQTDEITARLLAHLERENEFLRATVEQHQRSEAELRAALREALKVQPRQLAAPDETATNGQERPQSGAADNVPVVVQTAPESKRNSPLTYADIADQLERDLNQ